MKFSVRPARDADVPGMCGLLSELFSIESDFSPDREKQARGLRLLLRDTSGSSLVLVAEKGTELVGMCSVQRLISTSQGGSVGLVEDLIIHKDYRGMGIGARLLSGIIQWSETKDLSRLQLLRDADNFGAERFYTGNGWNNTRLVCMRKFI